MNKTLKKLIVAVLSMTLAFGCLTVPATAANTVKAGSTKTLEVNTKYQFKLSNDGYITISAKYADGYSKGTATYVQLYDCNKNKLNYSYRDGEIVALAKGTYYVSTYSSYAVSFCFKYTKATNEENYCLAKAIEVASGDSVTICQTWNYNYVRYYKVTLSSKKKLSLTANAGNSYFTIYKKDGHEVQLASAQSNSNGTFTISSKEKLPKGTYIIAVSMANINSESSSRNYQLGSFIQFKLK